MTDLPNRLLPRPAAPTARFAAPGNAALAAVDTARGGQEDIDVLSDVLRGVRLTASMFFLVEATTPWRTNAPAARAFARLVLPSHEHLISYHVVTEGTCWGGIRGEALQPMEAGDILVVPHGNPYHLSNPASAEPGASDDEAIEFFRQMVAGELPQVVTEGGRGSQRTRFICGFLGCDARPFNPILATLPPVLYLRRTMQADGPMRHLIAIAQAELQTRRPGSREVLLRLSELMFIAAIRCHAQQIALEASASPAGLHEGLHEGLPSDRHAGAHTGVRVDPPPIATGWLAGLHDPLVGRVLALLHSRPAQAWTLQALASEVGASRSALAARFTHVVGQPPIRYLAGWRMQLATRMLAEEAAKVRTVAEAVGYDSEAAFSRAFTRLVGSNPVAWRRRTGQAPSVASRPAAHAHGPGDVRRLMEPR